MLFSFRGIGKENRSADGMPLIQRKQHQARISRGYRQIKGSGAGYCDINPNIRDYNLC